MANENENKMPADLTLGNFQVVRAGRHPVFGDLSPDVAKAYITFECCRAFPSVIGPEMNGHVFGFHPKVLANSYRGLLHQQTNFHHRMASYGTARRDYVNGCIVGVAMRPGRSGGGIPEKPEDAADLLCLGVMFKAAQGVPKLLGEHQSSRKTWSVSVEAGYMSDESGVFDPRDRAVKLPDEYDDEILAAVKVDKEGVLRVGKLADGTQMAMALGGREGDVSMQGMAYTPTPAEKTAQINEVMASDGMLMVAATEGPEWYPGVEVAWPTALGRRATGGGTVRSVSYRGVLCSRGYDFEASDEDPLLEIELRSGLLVYRNASFVKKT